MQAEISKAVQFAATTRWSFAFRFRCYEVHAPVLHPPMSFPAREVECGIWLLAISSKSVSNSLRFT